MFLSSRLPRCLIALVAVCLVLGLDASVRPAVPTDPQAVYPGMYLPPASLGVSQASAAQWLPAGQGHIPMPPNSPAAHASSLLAMPAGHVAALTVFWFSGERESGPNVQIAASQWERATQQWAPARFVVNRHALGAQLGFGVRRLGNPVAWLDTQGRIHLFVVATGGGGWAASRIAHLRQSSAGNNLQELAFEPVRVLPLSWLWNTSHLVRNAPLPLADGGMVLPVHFELGIKYPLALRFGPQGDYVGLTRISGRDYALQPTLLAKSPREWVALMRDERPDGRVIAARTADGGQTWADLPDLSLVNPDSSVGGLALAPGQLLLAHNSSANSRATLDLSASADGLNWAKLKTLASGPEVDEYSYPAMAWLDGDLWVSYTVDRAHIDWQRFRLQGAPILAAGGKP
jgi:predicted neuraminidase